VLDAVSFGRPSALNVDPIEKKPLFHFLPGTGILSIGTPGCNLGCKFCQNWDLSRARFDQASAMDLPPERAVEVAQAHGCRSIAFTYNEPTVFAEYVMAVGEVARSAGLRTVMVTNGYIHREALYEVYEHVDAANVDLKGFDEGFYRKQAYGHLKPVLDSLVALAAMGVWLEVTTLLIPGLNTDPAVLRAEADWIRGNLGDRVPLHFSAFHPDFRMLDRPRTPVETLRMARDVARDAGLKFVYTGNVAEGADTFCPRCGVLAIRRSWHEVKEVRLGPDNRCACGELIPLAR
jgi:pyruvate formate lyase activating enzyme